MQQYKKIPKILYWVDKSQTHIVVWLHLHEILENTKKCAATGRSVVAYGQERETGYNKWENFWSDEIILYFLLHSGYVSIIFVKINWIVH